MISGSITNIFLNGRLLATKYAALFAECFYYHKRMKTISLIPDLYSLIPILIFWVYVLTHNQDNLGNHIYNSLLIDSIVWCLKCHNILLDSGPFKCIYWKVYIQFLQDLRNYKQAFYCLKSFGCLKSS